MAITSPKRIGRTRIKLAAMLEKAVPGVTVDPANLQSQNPYYSSRYFDCCSWTGYGTRNEHWDTYFYSWDTMGDLVKYGFECERERHAFQCHAMSEKPVKFSKEALFWREEIADRITVVEPENG